MKGGASALKYAVRDLPCLEAVIALTPQRRVAVQAGGNLGVWPKRLAKHFETVYTFEPSAELFPLLVANAPDLNIIRFQAALGSGPEMVGVSRVRRDGKPDPHEGITHIAGVGVIPTMTLDSLALPVCDLLYLDTEGWEYRALQGAEETLRRCRPVVAVEVNKNLHYVGVTEDMIRTFLAGVGYRFQTSYRSDQVWTPLEWAA